MNVNPTGASTSSSSVSVYIYNMGNRHNKQRINSNSGTSCVPILCSKNSVKDVAAVPSSVNFDHHRLHNDDESQDSSSSSSVITDELEPVSPKVGCMGQVNKKNKRSNRVAAGRSPAIPNLTPLNNITDKSNTTSTRRPSSANLSTKSAVVVAVNYSKLRRLFSGKKLLIGSTASPAVTTAMTTIAKTRTRSKSWVGPRMNPCRQTKPRINSGQQQQLNFIREMDPPLPVILPKKKLQIQADDEEEQDGEQGHEIEDGRSSLLWKRRFGDVSALKTLEINQLNTVQCRLRRPPPPQPLTV